MSDDERLSLDAELQIARGNSGDPFASAVRTTRMPMVITNPRIEDNPIVFCNDAFVRLTGYSRAEILGRNCRFLQGQATKREDVGRIRDALDRREGIEVDLLNYRKDGATFWNSLLISPVFVGEELTYFFASQLDVTHHKRAQEHSFLLHRELDHRVKNTLATVQGVVLQTLRDHAVAEPVATAVAGRLLALARSHDVMTREAWASALFRDVVEGALEPFVALGGERILIEGPDVRLKPRIATMLSLALHELGDNAARYGALSNETGTVSVAWTVENEILAFEWREEGGPPVVAPTRRGYGLRVVERVLAAEFNGSTEVDFARTGLVCRIEAPYDGLAREETAWQAPS